MQISILKSASLFILLFTVGCTTSISHKPLPNTLPTAQNQKSILIVIPPETKQFTESYGNLSGDKWIFEVGHALADIAPQVFRNQYGSVLVSDAIPSGFKPSALNQVVTLKIVSFKTDIGWTVFSTHDGTLTLSVEAQGKSTVNQTVSASGSDSGGSYLKTYGALLLPTTGINGYNEAMAVMITNAVSAASIQALQATQQCGS